MPVLYLMQIYCNSDDPLIQIIHFLLNNYIPFQRLSALWKKELAKRGVEKASLFQTILSFMIINVCLSVACFAVGNSFRFTASVSSWRDDFFLLFPKHCETSTVQICTVLFTTCCQILITGIHVQMFPRLTWH